MTSPFSFLQNSLKVSPPETGEDKVTVTLPADLVFLCLRVLNFLGSMVIAANSKKFDPPSARMPETTYESQRNLEFSCQLSNQRYQNGIAGRPNKLCSMKSATTIGLLRSSKGTSVLRSVSEAIARRVDSAISS